MTFSTASACPAKSAASHDTAIARSEPISSTSSRRLSARLAKSATPNPAAAAARAVAAPIPLEAPVTNITRLSVTIHPFGSFERRQSRKQAVIRLIYLDDRSYSYGAYLMSVDLNLLPVFVALMEERNVTRAAERLSMSQPALSNALRRLRDALGDSLFVRERYGIGAPEGAGGFFPSISAALIEIESTLVRQKVFD